MLTAAEYAWQELLDIGREMRENEPVSERHRIVRFATRSTCCRILAHSLGVMPSQVSLSAEVALRREQIREHIEAQA